MSDFSVNFWEIPADTHYLENLPCERALWFETREDRARRYAFEDFFKQVMPVVKRMIDLELTNRQKEILYLYYFDQLPQEEIASRLKINQSTVSRHLFGTMRHGKRIGGAIPKLQKAIRTLEDGPLKRPLQLLQEKLKTSSELEM